MYIQLEINKLIKGFIVSDKKKIKSYNLILYTITTFCLDFTGYAYVKKQYSNHSYMCINYFIVNTVLCLFTRPMSF